MHQDLSIPVRERREGPRLAGWSEKEGVLYVQPPVEVLEQLVAVRIHIDDCGPDHGPLRVVPGSHRLGRLGERDIPAVRQERRERDCVVGPGGALIMRPLLVHASSKAVAPNRRRVLHFLFGPEELPLGLEWSYKE
jgi:ectoine hydroxylase-related dioxygenase (phytanoyl-CoA dioxygenase family)